MNGVPFGRLPQVFARLRGRNGVVREYLALVSPGSDYSILPKVDAYRLGYPEAARDDPITEPPNLFRGATFDGFWEAPVVHLEEVTVGSVTSRHVDFLAYDLPQACAYDVVLGRTLLATSGMSVDYASGTVRIPSKGQSK